MDGDGHLPDLAEALGLPHRELRRVIDALLNPLILLTAVRDETGAIVDFVFADANAVAVEFYRPVLPGPVIGALLTEVNPAVRETGLMDSYVSVVETGEPLVLDDWSYPQDLLEGEQRWYDVRGIRVGDGLMQTWHDVTHQHLGVQAMMSIEAAALGIAIADENGIFTMVNPAMCRMLGYSADELVGRSFADVTHPDDVARGRQDVARLRRGEADNFTERKRYLRADGSAMWADTAVSVARTADGTIEHFVGQVIDVSGEMDAFDALQRSAARFRVLAENASDVVYQTTPDGTIQWISPSVRAVLGWEPDLLVGSRALSLVVPEDHSLVQATRATVYQQAVTQRARVRFRTATGDERTMSVLARPIVGDDGDVTGAIVGLRDITDEVAAERALARSEEQFRLAMDSAPNGMALTDSLGVVTRANPTLASLLHRAPEELVGHRLGEFLAPDLPAPGPGEHHMAGCRTAPARHVHEVPTPRGAIWVEHHISPLDPAGTGEGRYVHQFIDQTATHTLQDELEYRATHDDLTGLANRGDLLTRLRERISGTAGPPGTRHRVGVLFCDVDNLKPINDEYGHSAGDVVLESVAERLSGAVREGDIAGRFGGDEFLVVLDHVRDGATLLELSEKIHDAVGGSVTDQGRVIPVSLSIGAVLADSGDDPDDVLRRADAALYRAKQYGRDRVVVDTDEQTS